MFYYENPFLPFDFPAQSSLQKQFPRWNNSFIFY
jgi:hypothetical protein